MQDTERKTQAAIAARNAATAAETFWKSILRQRSPQTCSDRCHPSPIGFTTQAAIATKPVAIATRVLHCKSLFHPSLKKRQEGGYGVDVSIIHGYKEPAPPWYSPIQHPIKVLLLQIRRWVQHNTTHKVLQASPHHELPGSSCGMVSISLYSVYNIEDNVYFKCGGVDSIFYVILMQIKKRKSHKLFKRQIKSWDGSKIRKGGPSKK